ncbi:DNA-binding transcriptional LysR family regulator [Bradyrhizobium sp. USDA 3650]
MDLLALADFNLVARHGGFGRAARAAGRPKATLSRRVAELEAALDLRLFERGARTLKLTQEGRALYERTGALLTELDETATAIASGGDRPRGRLRISAPMLFSQTAMGNLAAGFALRYPEIRLEVTTEDRSVDMVEEGYDLVIRVNPDPDDSLVGRIFLRDRLVVVASPNLKRPREGIAVPAVMRGAGDRKTSWDVTVPSGQSRIAIDPVLRLSSLVMVPRCGPGRRRRRTPSGITGQSRPGCRHAGALGRHRRTGDRIVDALSIAPAVERARLRLPRLHERSLSDGDA